LKRLDWNGKNGEFLLVVFANIFDTVTGIVTSVPHNCSYTAR